MTQPGDTLADVVMNDVSTTRILDRLGLDYCCGGDETLDHACTRLGLATADVVAQLDTTAVLDEHHDCGAMPVADLVAHLLAAHHSYLHDELPQLDQIADKVLDVHGRRHPELHEVRALVRALYGDLEPHMVKEERVLFPAILELLQGPVQLPFGSINNPIRMMNLEHDRVGDLLTRLRATTNDYAVPDDACTSFRALYERLAELEHDTHLHVFEENQLLFPQAAALEAHAS